MTSKPLVRRTLATLRSAEFGFFGVVVYTRVQTPRFCGFCSIAGTFDLAFCGSRPLRISWLIVGMKPFTFRCRKFRRLLCPTGNARSPSSLPAAWPFTHVEQCSALARREDGQPADERRHSDGAVRGQLLLVNAHLPSRTAW